MAAKGNLYKKPDEGGFPDGLVVNASNARDAGLILGQETKILHATWPKNK